MDSPDKNQLQDLKDKSCSPKATIDMPISTDEDNTNMNNAPSASSLPNHCPDHGPDPVSSTVSTTNRFSALSECSETDTNDNSVQDMERLIDSYNDAIQSTKVCEKTQRSQEEQKFPTFQQQLSQYREKYRQRHNCKPSPKPRTDILVIGDSMIKHVKGHKLSRTKQVKCSSQPGDKVDDFYLHVIAEVKEHKPSEIILHIGTNNGKNSAEDIRLQR